MTDQHHNNPQQSATAPEQQPAKQPVDRVSEGGVNASIWENDSKNGKFHNLTVSRSYKDANGNFQNTNSFRRQDMPALMAVSSEAYGRMRTLDRNARREAFDAKRQEPTQNHRQGRDR